MKSRALRVKLRLEVEKEVAGSEETLHFPLWEEIMRVGVLKALL